VSDTGQTPPPDQDVRSSLLRLGGGALALVVLVAVVFFGIGNVTRDETPVVADAPEETETVEEAPEEEPEPAPEPDDEDGSDAGDEADEDADGDADDEEGSDDEDGDDATDEDEDAEDDDAPSVDPGSVTIQVLDGFKQDGGAAADGVADTLGGDGYQVIARNDALAYDVTTVLYNPGSEDAAQQVAQTIGAGDVRAQSGNLSTAVDLHVVVGSDRG
jgi:hypothetical protein